MRRCIFRPISLLLFLFLADFAVVQARTSRIMTDAQREDYLNEIRAIADYEDPKLEEAIPYIINPFFFDLPLLLKLKAPGGISDEDVLLSFSNVILNEISGAFVRGTKRSLLMKSGELLREGDQITRQLPDLGNIEAKVTVREIHRDRFVLKLNNSEYVVDLSGN